MKKLLLPLLALVAVIAPIPGKADAYIGYIVATTCADRAVQSGNTYYICYDISAETISVLRSSGAPNYTVTYQYGPIQTTGNRNPSTAQDPYPTLGAYWGSNEILGGVDGLGIQGVQFYPSPSGYNWRNQTIFINPLAYATYNWSAPQVSAGAVTRLQSYANSNIPSYRGVVVP